MKEISDNLNLDATQLAEEWLAFSGGGNIEIRLESLQEFKRKVSILLS